jgi:CHAT domain-containing protein
LGLAGVAVRAGARSAVATLWSVDDRATSRLIQNFYQELLKKDVPKAKALRNSQIALIHSEEYRHPIYWAPFLLIGNWM